MQRLSCFQAVHSRQKLFVSILYMVFSEKATDLEKLGEMNMGKKNMRRISILVTAQTAHNLERLADMDGCRDVGRIVDKLTREKMLSLRVGKRERLRG